VGAALWFLSLRKSVRSIPLRVSAIGVVLFVSTDLYFWYIDYNELYTPNSVIDALYMGALLLIAFAALIECYFGKKSQKGLVTDGGSNIGLEKKSLLMMIIPLIVFLVEGFVLIDFFVLLILILIHQVLSIFLQDAIRSKALLQNEKKNTIFLEEEIARRLQEIQEKNKELQDKNKKLDILSNQDTITNLYNRRYFMSVLEEAIKNCPEGNCVGLMFLDLDRFKIINDMYGHQIGDEVLIEVSKRLEMLQGEKTMLARLGGDEYVISYKGQFTYAFLEKVAQNLITMFMYPIEVESYMFNISVCIGLSVYPLDAEDAYSLLRNADMAMYQAKKNGKNQIVTFRSSFSEIMKRKNDIEILLKQADFNKEFQLFYQPQFRVEDKKLIGAEALLRWSNSPIGFISPAEFIPVAEEINVINEIGSWVLDNAIKQLKLWSDFNLEEFKLGINVSPKQLDYKNFVSELTNIINRHQISTKLIDIELTESIAIEGEERIQQIVSIFSNLGLSISIDDFGTGYSALSYLKIFPFERIKIAKQLIDSITFDNYDLQIVKAIIQLAKSIGIKTIAEGVETQDQFDILKCLGCDEIQGYLLGKPVSAAAFMEIFLGGKDDVAN
jgi:diguanylate cyclase (GGDEF)-like protein